MGLDPGENELFPIGRRTVLKSAAIAGIGSGIIPNSVSAASDTYILGEFEEGLDGWGTDGGVTLSRIVAADRPAVVENGDYALAVKAGGDTYPVIENKRNLKGNSFVDAPFLLGRISTTLTGDHNMLTVVLRYHHRATPAEGDQSTATSEQGSSEDQKPVLVEETTTTVPLGSQSALSWDLSVLSTEKLETPEKLEIGWYIGDSAPERGPHGEQQEGPEPGTVYLDTIRMTDRRSFVDRASLINHIHNLRAQHGDFIYKSREFFDDGERGVFVCKDEAEIPVVWEAIEADRELYTVDGTTYRLGGGWE